MKIINITIFVFLFVIQAYSLPNGVKSETPEAEKKNLSISPIPYTTLPDDPQPPPPTTVAPANGTSTTIQPPTNTTVAPVTSTTTPVIPTSSTTLGPSTNTTLAPNTTTLAPITTTIAPNTTTLAPNTTTLAPNTTTLAPSNVTTQAPTTLAPATTTVVPHSHTQHFDFPSFIGGIMLTLGLLAIGFVSHKFYKARTDRNYHTL